MLRLVSRLVWTLPILAAAALLGASGIEAQVGAAQNDEAKRLPMQWEPGVGALFDVIGDVMPPRDDDPAMMQPASGEA